MKAILLIAGFLKRWFELEASIYQYVPYVIAVIALGWGIKGIETLVRKKRKK